MLLNCNVTARPTEVLHQDAVECAHTAARHAKPPTAGCCRQNFHMCAQLTTDGRPLRLLRLQTRPLVLLPTAAATGAAAALRCRRRPRRAVAVPPASLAETLAHTLWWSHAGGHTLVVCPSEEPPSSTFLSVRVSLCTPDASLASSACSCACGGGGGGGGGVTNATGVGLWGVGTLEGHTWLGVAMV